MHFRQLYFLTLLLFVFSCGSPEKEAEGEILEYSDEFTEESKEDLYEEAEDGDFEGVDMKHVLFCRIGLYQKPAIMVLNWMEEDENGVFPIEGFYFYVSHQKNLDLKGYSEPSTRGIYLTESYKGKETGYMQFAQDAHLQPWDGENYWSPEKGSADKQAFYSEDLIATDPMETNIALQYDKFTNPHSISIYEGGEAGFSSEEVIDELNWVIINDEHFAFDIHTMGNNAHMGSANGLTKIKGDKAIWISDTEDQCKLTFDLSNYEKEISVTEENCEYYHGMNASFDWTFSKD